MRAVRFDGQAVRLAEASAPAPLPGEVLIKPILCGISGVDREIAAAASSTTPATTPTPRHSPITLGHEFVGTVVEVNAGTSSAAERARKLKGKRVTGAMSVSCGKCELCRGGLSSHCRARAVVGAHRDGCFAECLSLPISSVHLVPDAVDNVAAVFSTLLAAAAHSAQMLRVEGKPYITILGDGPLGLLTAQVMARLNASVRLLGKHPHKFGLCERWGIKHRHVSEVGRRGDQDVVVDCTGRAEGLRVAMQLVRPRGKIILKSTRTRLPTTEPTGAPTLTPPTPPTPARAIRARETADASGEPIDLSPLVNNEIELIGCRCGSVDDALRRLAAREIDTTTLVAGRVRLDAVPAALLAKTPAGQARPLTTLVDAG